jgi:hypothetical protein
MTFEKLNLDKFRKNQIGPDALRHLVGGGGEVHRSYESHSGNGTCVDQVTLLCTGRNYDQDSKHSTGETDHLEFETKPSHWDKS